MAAAFRRALQRKRNLSGRKLPAARKREIAKAKQELRRLFGKER